MKVQAVQAVKAEDPDVPLALVLAVAGLARATYYYHRARGGRPDPHAALKVAIQTHVTHAKGRYGHRRIQRELGKNGWRVAKKTVLAQMRELGLSCQVRRRKRGITSHGAVGTTAPNRLNRVFTAIAPNQTWVSDITEFRIGEEKCYLAPVMDLCDRQIIAYTIGRAPTLELATSALRRALATLPPDAQPLVHTDQGFQYQHRAWHQLLAEAGATASMSRKGTCLDNAVIESFFGHLKSELLLERFASIAALETALHAYVQWYNHERTSATLNGQSPVQYRALAGWT